MKKAVSIAVERTMANGRRRGLSIMEVLFAIGVLTVGLLGVASILPVATNNAANVLETDRAVEEINNRVAQDLARIEESFTDVIIANNSASASSQRFNQISTQRFRDHISRYDSNFQQNSIANPAANALHQPQLPDAFCIDPWFLSAASNIRNDVAPNVFNNRNAYDRTLFPCYDPRYVPIAYSPSDQLSQSTPAYWDGPRFTRIAIPFEGTTGLLSPSGAEVQIRESDDFSLFAPDDSTLPKGLFVQRSGNDARSLSKNTVSSRFSSMVVMSRSTPGSSIFDAAVVTMLDRQVVAVPGGDVIPRPGSVPAHNLAPYTAADPSIVNGASPPENQLLYAGEQLGYVTYAKAPFVGGGGGEFTFRTSRYVKPSLASGDWIMLMRREYVRDRNIPGGGGSDPQIHAAELKFAWYQVSEVLQMPQLATSNSVTSYNTRIRVRGPDWVFHPIQITTTAGVYGPPYFGNVPQPTWGTPPVFDYDQMPGRGANPNATGTGTNPFTPVYEHQDYGTFIVIMPDVISVKQFQVEL